jgi:GR25 family glycosyltransferase involved in LPS biosynthesis
MQNTVAIKVINLEHRVDRRAECAREIELAKLMNFEVEYFPAKYLKNMGARGCSLSHAMCLSKWLFQENQPYIMVLEDDFSIGDHSAFLQHAHTILNSGSTWDVFLLGHNQAVPTMATNNPNIFRVANAQTTSGYIVTRAYAPKLIEIFFRSANLLDQPQLDNNTKIYLYSCDILWKELQIRDRFLSYIPALILQRPSFSDITNTTVDYKT